jgi:hypothetical protein
MKNNKANRALKWVVLAGLAAAFSVRPTQADVILNQFNTASEVSQWRFDFGNVTHSEAFDPAQDANGNAASGSMKVTLGFDATLGFNNKGAYTRDIFPGLDGTTFSSMQMDVKVASSSALDAFGNNGLLALVIRNTSGYNYIQQFGDNVRSADGWRHFSVSPLTAPVNDIRGVTWQLYGGPSQNITGPVTLWFDNVSFTSVPEPSPLALAALGALGLLLWRMRGVIFHSQRSR